MGVGVRVFVNILLDCLGVGRGPCSSSARKQKGEEDRVSVFRVGKPGFFGLVPKAGGLGYRLLAIFV